MKVFNKLIVMLFIIICGSIELQAKQYNVISETDESYFRPGWYYNVHVAKVETSLNNGNQEFDYTNLGGVFGYQYTENFSAEVLLSFSLNDQTDRIFSNNPALNTSGITVETHYSAIAGYAAFKTSGDLYFKAKAGLGYSTFGYTFSSTFANEVEGNFDFSYGLGIGYSTPNDINFSLEYIKMPDSEDPLFSASSYENKMFTFSVGSSFR